LVDENIISALAAQGIDSPFPIQIDTLPDSLKGRDVLGRGKTGSGKTLAFSIPLVTRLAQNKNSNARGPRGLVLAPTRELATQIAATLVPLAEVFDLRVTTIFGGVSQGRQVQAIKQGVEIVVATPGRLEDLMGQGLLRLDNVEVTVLDEADHMADLGFLPGVTRILTATPKGGQRLLFSATLDNGINQLADRFLSDPVLHSVDEANSPVSQMTHHVFEAADADQKKQLVYALASGSGRRILFMRTKHHAKKLAKALTSAGIPAADLHGNLSQGARDRNLAAFSDGSVKVLVATDVAARGVHVDSVDLVVHVDPPAEHKAYLHRSGRTARAGAEGDVITICLPEQRKDLAELLQKAKINVTPLRVTKSSPEVVELIGQVAEYVKPVAVATQKPRPGSGSGRAKAKARPAHSSGGNQNRPARPGKPAAGGSEGSQGQSRSVQRAIRHQAQRRSR
jgi:superfamily II DNA/RNA helicase